METQKALVFVVQNRLFGIDSSFVDEVVLHQFMSRQHGVREPFVALAKIRNEHIPVVCACQRLGFERHKNNCYGNVIVLKFEHEKRVLKLGLIVDAVDGMLKYDLAERLPFAASKKNNSFSNLMLGTVVCHNLPIYILEVMKFVGFDKILTDHSAQEELFSVA